MPRPHRGTPSRIADYGQLGKSSFGRGRELVYAGPLQASRRWWLKIFSGQVGQVLHDPSDPLLLPVNVPPPSRPLGDLPHFVLDLVLALQYRGEPPELHVFKEPILRRLLDKGVMSTEIIVVPQERSEAVNKILVLRAQLLVFCPLEVHQNILVRVEPAGEYVDRGQAQRIQATDSPAVVQDLELHGRHHHQVSRHEFLCVARPLGRNLRGQPILHRYVDIAHAKHRHLDEEIDYVDVLHLPGVWGRQAPLLILRTEEAELTELLKEIVAVIPQRAGGVTRDTTEELCRCREQVRNARVCAEARLCSRRRSPPRASPGPLDPLEKQLKVVLYCGEGSFREEGTVVVVHRPQVFPGVLKDHAELVVGIATLGTQVGGLPVAGRREREAPLGAWLELRLGVPEHVPKEDQALVTGEAARVHRPRQDLRTLVRGFLPVLTRENDPNATVLLLHAPDDLHVEPLRVLQEGGEDLAVSVPVPRHRLVSRGRSFIVLPLLAPEPLYRPVKHGPPQVSPHVTVVRRPLVQFHQLEVVLFQLLSQDCCPWNEHVRLLQQG
mmetsp:Transcript_957/g.2847  ORF Transcript_957/g.2847 Transcript_957/m.2847 type:complete len:552 (-) Transcript_957:231-1886(-)